MRTQRFKFLVCYMHNEDALWTAEFEHCEGAHEIHLDKEVDVGARMFEPCTSDQNEATSKKHNEWRSCDYEV